MHKIIVLASILSTVAFAGPKETLEKLDQIQKFTQSMSTDVYNPACLECTNYSYFSKCAQDICAKGTIKQSYMDLLNYRLETLPISLAKPAVKEAHEKLKASMRKIFSLDLESYNSSLEDLKNLISNDKFTNDDEKLKLYVVFNLMSFIKKEDQKTLPPYLKEKAKKFSEIFSKEVAKIDGVGVMESPERYFNTVYPNLSIKDAIDSELKKYEILKEKFLKTSMAKNIPDIRKEIEDFYNTQFYINYKQNRNYAINDAKDLLQQLSALKLFAALSENSDLATLQDSIDPKEIKKLIYSQEMKSNIKAMDANLSVYKQNSKYFDSLVDNCANTLLATYIAYPDTKTRDAKIKVLNEAAKSAIAKNFFPRLSKETRASLEKDLPKWKFMSPSREEFLRDTSYQVENSASDSERSLKIDAARSDEQKLTEASADISLFKYPKQYGKETEFVIDEVFGDSTDLCDDAMNTVIDDSSYAVDGSIVVGWGSLTDDAAGKAVAEHELGHLISAKMNTDKVSTHSKGLYNQSMSCLTKKHGNEANNEEDFADLVSALSEGESGNNLGCFFKQDSKNGLNPDDSDEHSSNFFRLLHVETMMRKSLPPTCKKYLEVSNAKTDFSSCWPEEQTSK